MNEPVNIHTTLDVGAVTLWVATFAQVLPSIAAVLSIIWFAIRIMESETVQSMLGSWSWIKKETSSNGTTKDID